MDGRTQVLTNAKSVKSAHSRLSVSQEDGVYDLTIRSVVKDDEQLYQCIVSTGHELYRQAVFLKVLGGKLQ